MLAVVLIVINIIIYSLTLCLQSMKNRMKMNKKLNMKMKMKMKMWVHSTHIFKEIKTTTWHRHGSHSCIFLCASFSERKKLKYPNRK